MYLGTLLVGFLLGAIAPIGTATVTGLVDPAVISDSIRGDAPFAASVKVWDSNAAGGKGMFAFAETLKPEEANTEPLSTVGADPLNPYPDEFMQFVTMHHGMKVPTLETDISLRGLHETPVRITDIRVHFIRKDPPLKGTLLCDPNAGSNDVDVVVFDLDDDTPVPMIETSDGNSRPYLQAKSVTLTRNEIVTIHVRFTTDTHSAIFDLRFDYESNGVPGSTFVNNLGIPFELTGPAAPDSFDASDVLAGWTLNGYETLWVRGPGHPFSWVEPGTPDATC